MLVATKYLNLTRNFFAEHDIVDYRLFESQGATEGAPASGAADIIVDITSSGDTLRANNLRVLQDDPIMRSEACLFMSKAADWSKTATTALDAIKVNVGL